MQLGVHHSMSMHHGSVSLFKSDAANSCSLPSCALGLHLLSLSVSSQEAFKCCWGPWTYCITHLLHDSLFMCAGEGTGPQATPPTQESVRQLALQHGADAAVVANSLQGIASSFNGKPTMKYTVNMVRPCRSCACNAHTSAQRCKVHCYCHSSTSGVRRACCCWLDVALLSFWSKDANQHQESVQSGHCSKITADSTCLPAPFIASSASSGRNPCACARSCCCKMVARGSWCGRSLMQPMRRASQAVRPGRMGAPSAMQVPHVFDATSNKMEASDFACAHANVETVTRSLPVWMSRLRF